MAVQTAMTPNEVPAFSKWRRQQINTIMGPCPMLPDIQPKNQHPHHNWQLLQQIWHKQWHWGYRRLQRLMVLELEQWRHGEAKQAQQQKKEKNMTNTRQPNSWALQGYAHPMISQQFGGSLNLQNTLMSIAQ